MATKVYTNAEPHCEIFYSHAVSRNGIFFCCFKVDDTYEDMRFICLRNDEERINFVIFGRTVV